MQRWNIHWYTSYVIAIGRIRTILRNYPAIVCVSGARKRFRRPTTSAPSVSNDQEVSASVNRLKVTRNRVSNKNTKNELQPSKTNDYKVHSLFAIWHLLNSCVDDKHYYQSVKFKSFLQVAIVWLITFS